MHVAAVIKRKGSDVVTIAADQTIAEAVNVLTERRIGALLVMDGNDADGIISERDIVGALSRNGADVLTQKVSDLMTRDVRSCSCHDTIAKVMNIMTQGRVRHLPVMMTVSLSASSASVTWSSSDWTTPSWRLNPCAATSRCSPVSTGDTDLPMWLIHLRHPVQARNGSARPGGVCARMHRPRPPRPRRECGDLSALHRA